MPVIEANARRNRGLLDRGGGGEVTTAVWSFGRAPPSCIGSLLLGSESFDVVLGSDITYSVNEERDCLSVTLHQLLASGLARRCVIAHEHRRADMFDVDAIVANVPAARWDENDVRATAVCTTFTHHTHPAHPSATLIRHTHLPSNFESRAGRRGASGLFLRRLERMGCTFTKSPSSRSVAIASSGGPTGALLWWR